ncbi:MAG: hypothetical protein AAGF27_06730 [Pseudomonadota bacterium]
MVGENTKIRKSATRLLNAAQLRLTKLEAAHARANLRGHTLIARRLSEEIQRAELELAGAKARRNAIMLRTRGRP